MKEKLKVGEYYRMRDGRRVKIEKIETSSDWVIPSVMRPLVDAMKEITALIGD